MMGRALITVLFYTIVNVLVIMKQKVLDMLEALKKAWAMLIGKVRGLWSGVTKETLYWVVPVLVVLVALVVFVAKPANDSTAVDGDDTVMLEDDTERTLSLEGTYTSGMLPAASTPGREFTLVLNEDGTTTFTGDYKNGDRLVVEKGTWSRADDRVTLTLVSRFGFPLEQPVTHVFAVSEESLVLVDYDNARWGSLGLTLKRSK